MWFFYVSSWLSPFLNKTELFVLNLDALICTPFSSCIWAEIIKKLKKPFPAYRPVVSPEYAPPECLQLMKQCWAEAVEQRPTFDDIFNQVKTLWILLLPEANVKPSLPRITHWVFIRNYLQGKGVLFWRNSLWYDSSVALGGIQSWANPPKAQEMKKRMFFVWICVPGHPQSGLKNLSSDGIESSRICEVWY